MAQQWPQVRRPEPNLLQLRLHWTSGRGTPATSEMIETHRECCRPASHVSVVNYDWHLNQERLLDLGNSTTWEMLFLLPESRHFLLRQRTNQVVFYALPVQGFRNLTRHTC